MNPTRLATNSAIQSRTVASAIQNVTFTRTRFCDQKITSRTIAMTLTINFRRSPLSGAFFLVAHCHPGANGYASMALERRPVM